MRRRRDKGSRCGSSFHPCVQGIQREATPLQEFTLWYTLPRPLCRASNMRRVRGQRTTDSFKRLLLCIFSHTGRIFTRICEVLPNQYTPQWIAARIGLHEHGSLLGDDVWYAVYWDYSDLPSDTWKQTARSLWLAMLSERGVTPTTADQIKFDVFVTCLPDAPLWQEQIKLEKAGRASQKEASADVQALGLGPSSLERRKHTLASYLMGPNAVGRKPSTREMAPHQWSCISAALQGTGQQMLRASAKELQQGNVHTALPDLPNCLCTAVCNLYAMKIQNVWSSTRAHTTCH